jgi:hypothetical protein
MPDGPLPPADVAISSGPETARIAVEASSALFKVCLVQGRGDAMSLDELGLRYVCVGEEAAAALKNGQRRNAVVLAQPLEAEALERVLLDLCFARLDPDYKQASA